MENCWIIESYATEESTFFLSIIIASWLHLLGLFPLQVKKSLKK